jgi:nicotinamidase-related amidase
MVVLCVIDMQPFFDAARNLQLIDKVIDQIIVSIKRKEHILIVTYDRCGETDHRILNAVDGYKHVKYVTKKNDDGSPEIVKTLEKFTLTDKETIKVCGVNTWACVKQTYTGLAHKLPDSTIVVLENLCRGTEYNSHTSLTEYLTKKRLYSDEDYIKSPYNMRSIKRRFIDVK